MQSARPGWLRTDKLRNLQLPLCVRRADNCLELTPFGRLPFIVPDDPGVGRHGLFDLAFVPCPAGIEAQFHLADGVGATEGDAAEELLLPAERLVMAGAVDA